MRPAEIGVDVHPVAALAEASRQSDLCVTCTPSQSPLLRREDVAPGAFVAGVGADSEHKQELDPGLLAIASVVVDSLEQCAAIGDLHHALRGGAMSLTDVRAELSDVVGGRKPGRRSPDDIVIFDSTGVAIEDVAAAAMVFEKAIGAARGIAIDLGT